jgi:hypothetical protein
MVKILLSLFRRFSRIKNAQPIENRTPACASQRRNRCVQNQYFAERFLQNIEIWFKICDPIKKRTGFKRNETSIMQGEIKPQKEKLLWLDF